ncbi:MAG: TRAP transporter small permease subunit [Desulfobacteraceae bacterium]|jgi:TRAP-type mannitol/chloroaromatic compound transport system permease small subunit
MTTEKQKELVPNRFSDLLDSMIRTIGHVVMWANVVLIVVIILQVVLRYGFGRGLVVLEELQWHLYAVGIMFGASYAQILDSHIRVDIIHARLSDKWKLRWDLFGVVFLLLPFIVVIFLQSLEFVGESWRLGERSDAPLGLPWRWAVKSVIPISFALLGVATISRAVRIISNLGRPSHGVQ